MWKTCFRSHALNLTRKINLNKLKIGLKLCKLSTQHKTSNLLFLSSSQFILERGIKSLEDLKKNIPVIVWVFLIWGIHEGVMSNLTNLFFHS